MGHDDRLGPGAESLASLLGSTSSRRSLLKGGLSLAAALASPGRLLADVAVARPLPGSTADRVVVADDYRYDVIIRWGDPLFSGAEALDAVAAARSGLLGMVPAVAERQFGYNNDGVHFFPLDVSSNRGIVCVNHEYTNEELFLPGLVRIETADPRQMADYVRRHPGVVPLTQAMHGVSILVIERDEHGSWQHVAGTPHARRITGVTPCEITGPARGHPLLRTVADRSGTRVLGTLNNCAGGQTPWGTFLTAEENVDYYFGGGAALGRLEATVQQAHRRLPPRHASIHGWEHVDARFDLGREPTELLRFGWIVEIDPYDPTATPKKRTALGRCKHEGAATAMTRDGRLAVYSGDDDRFEYLYKFVTAGRVSVDRSPWLCDPGRRRAAGA